MLHALEQVVDFDIRFFAAVFKWTDRKALSTSMRWVSRSGDGYLYPLIAASIYTIDVAQANRFLFVALVAYAVELPLYVLVKNVVRRCRPCQALHAIKALIVPSDPFSFPSGHTAAAWVMALLLVFFSPIAACLAFPWAISVGFSRIFLGVHYPTDILAGILLGSASAAFAITVVA